MWFDTEMANLVHLLHSCMYVFLICFAFSNFWTGIVCDL